MNVLNQLDSESSSDSNGNRMEDIVAIAEDGDHSEHELDGVTDQGISIESDSIHIVETLLFPC